MKRRVVCLTLVVAGLALLAAPWLWRVSDPYGDSRNLALTAGAALLVVGAALSLLPYRKKLLPASEVGSGLALLAVGVLLLGLATLCTSKGTMFLLATFFLSGLQVGIVGLVRTVLGLVKR